MIARTDRPSKPPELSAVQLELKLKVQAYPRTGGLLDCDELTVLHRHRGPVGIHSQE